jgi:hypothetical protein
MLEQLSLFTVFCKFYFILRYKLFIFFYNVFRISILHKLNHSYFLLLNLFFVFFLPCFCLYVFVNKGPFNSYKSCLLSFRSGKAEGNQREEGETVLMLSCRHLDILTTAVATLISDRPSKQTAGRSDWSAGQPTGRSDWPAVNIDDAAIRAVDIGVSFTILVPVASGKTEIMSISVAFLC